MTLQPTPLDPGEPPAQKRRGGSGKKPEWSFQERVIAYLTHALPEHAYVVGIDSGAADPLYIKLAKIKRGIKPGQPDVRIECDGIGVDIELKVGTNTPSENQKAMMRRLQRNGHIVFPVWTLQEVEQGCRAAGLPITRTADAHEAIHNLSRKGKKRSTGLSMAPAKPGVRAIAKATAFQNLALGIRR